MNQQEPSGTNRNQPEPGHQPQPAAATAGQHNKKGTAMPDKDYLTVEEVAHVTGFSDRFIRNHIKAGNLIALKIGRTYRIRHDEVHEFMDYLAEQTEAA